MSKIQGAGIKNSTEIVAAGGTVSQLPNDDQAYITALGINKTLKQAIEDGNLGSVTALTMVKSYAYETGTPVNVTGDYIKFPTGTVVNSNAAHLEITNDSTDGVKITVKKAGTVIIHTTMSNSNTTDAVKIYKNGAEYGGVPYALSALAYNGASRDDVSSASFTDIAAVNDYYQIHINVSYLSSLIGKYGVQATLIAGGGANSIYDIQFGSAVTSDGTRSSTSYGATTNPISITFTPVANCIYKISCPFNFYGTVGNTNKFVIENTAGSATLMSQADVIQDATTGYFGTFNDEAIAYYKLSAGVSYTFELWCKSSGGGTITVNNSGTTNGTKMIAEAVGYSSQKPFFGVAEYFSYATTTSTIPIDNTIPQNTEGAEFMSLVATPTKIGSKLKITVNMITDASVFGMRIAALFKDSDTDAMAAGYVGAIASGTNGIVSFVHEYTTTSLSSITFKVRAGCDNAGTFTFNGRGGADILGGVSTSTLTIEEIL